MLQKNVFEMYNRIFDLGEIDIWFANGYNSVRVRFVNGKEVVFTYMSDLDWKLETLDAHIMSMSKPNKGTKKSLRKSDGKN